MFIVAYLYSNNGMGSWCWEAAHALHEAHQPVLLICSNEVNLPGSPAVEIVRFNSVLEEKSRQSVLTRVFQKLSRNSSGFVYQLHLHLKNQGITPTAYFLNQSDLQDPRVKVPQYVAAWAYPTSLSAYLSKLGKWTGWKPSKAAFWLSLDAVGWWRKDWRSYHSATSVLAVSQRLGSELASLGISVQVVHPGTSICTEKPRENGRHTCKLLIAALGLEDPRKRVRWMIDALKSGVERNYSLTLVGYASDDFKRWVCSDRFGATFTGYLSREQLQLLMADHDVFLFGSCLDDWGYVLVEAMSQGLSIVAPNLSPFDEIIGNAGSLYSSSSSEEFRQKVYELLHSDLLPLRQAAWHRASQMFSRQAFGQSVLTAVSETKK